MAALLPVSLYGSQDVAATAPWEGPVAALCPGYFPETTNAASIRPLSYVVNTIIII